MRTIREEPDVQRIVDEAMERWARAENAWETVQWALAHDPTVGEPLTEGGTARALSFQGARSIDMPTVTVLYVIEPEFVTIHSARFEDAQAFQAGRG